MNVIPYLFEVGILGRKKLWSPIARIGSGGWVLLLARAEGQVAKHFGIRRSSWPIWSTVIVVVCQIHKGEILQIIKMFERSSRNYKPWNVFDNLRYF
jgi:hypothetical protein